MSGVLLAAAHSAILLARKDILPLLKEFSCKPLLTITAWFLLCGLAVAWCWIWPVHPVVGCSVARVAVWCFLHVHKHQDNSTFEDLLLILPANMKLLLKFTSDPPSQHLSIWFWPWTSTWVTLVCVLLELNVFSAWPSYKSQYWWEFPWSDDKILKS